MSDAATIRIAAPGDEHALARLNRHVQELHVAARPDRFKRTELAEVTEWFRSRLQAPDVHIWIALAGAAPVGYLVAVLHRQAEHAFCFARRYYQIDQLALDPAWRRQGIARALVDEVVRLARAEGDLDVQLTAWVFNDGARVVFERLGFVAETIHFCAEGPR